MWGAEAAHVEEPHGDQNKHSSPDMPMTGAGSWPVTEKMGATGTGGTPGQLGERLTKQLEEHLHPTMSGDYYT